MKNLFLFVSLFVATVAGFAAAPTTRTIQIPYENNGQTRELAVVIPAHCKFPDTYFRCYVGTYISWWNTKRRQEITRLGNPPKPGREKLLAALKASELARFEDDDQIAPADNAKSDNDIGPLSVTKGAATIAAQEAVEADLKVLRAKNR